MSHEKQKRYEKEWEFSFRMGEPRDGQFSAPLEGVRTAEIKLDFSVGEATVAALPADSTSLIEIDARYVGDVEFTVEGEGEHRTVRLRQRKFGWEGGFNFSWGSERLYWHVRIHPTVATALVLNSGAGKGEFNLGGLQLTALDINTGAGKLDVQLPAMAQRYRGALNTGAGELNATLAAGADVELKLNTGAGKLKLDIGAGSVVEAALSSGVGQTILVIPGDVGVQVKASGGIGSLDFPDDFERIKGHSSFLAQNGIWQTVGYDNAARKISVKYSGGVGQLKVERSFAVV